MGIDIEMQEAIVRMEYMLIPKNVLLASISGHEKQTLTPTQQIYCHGSLTACLQKTFYLSPSLLSLLYPSVE